MNKLIHLDTGHVIKISPTSHGVGGIYRGANRSYVSYHAEPRGYDRGYSDDRRYLTYNDEARGYDRG